jgi:sugar lactone lactonase YvrE
MKRSLSFMLSPIAILAATASCGGESTPPPQSPPPVTSAAPEPAGSAAAATPPAAASAAPATPAEPPKPAPPTPVVKYTGLSTPESVLYDADNDRYLVSNINGNPTEKDNNGFISVLSPDGQVTTLKWIEGGKNKVKLDAPKGLALVKGVLYAADISVVRAFDAKTGAPKADIPVPGSTFLNDLASSPEGKIYVSDSGLKAGASGLEPDGTDAVYVIEKGKAKPIAKSTELGAPNGVLWTDKGLIVVSFGVGEVYRLDDKGKKQDVTKTPAGALDGVVALGDSLLVSSWQASAVFRGKLGGTFDVVLSDQKSPADIGYDTKRGRVIIPHFLDNTVEVYDLK